MEGSIEKGEFRNCMEALLLRKQARAQTKEKRPVRVESVDKIGNHGLSEDCYVTEFRGIETALYKIFHRTIGHEPFKIVQTVTIVRRVASDSSDIRSDDDVRQTLSICGAHISDRGRAKYVEHIDDILKTFINEAQPLREIARPNHRRGETLQSKK